MPVPSEQAIKVVLVDDHVLVRQGLREILRPEDDIEVVGEAGDSESAVTEVRDKQPHIVLLDVEIPGDEVTTTVRRMRTLAPDTSVIVLSMYDGPMLLQELLALGIKGYLLKSITRHELIAAIRSARDDQARILLSVSRASLAQVGGPSGSVLSERERTVLQLVAQAMSNAQVASQLSLTEATVKRHLRNIFAKLGAVSRIDAVNKATVASLIDRPVPEADTTREYRK